jgi:hypothetical protein
VFQTGKAPAMGVDSGCAICCYFLYAAFNAVHSRQERSLDSVEIGAQGMIFAVLYGEPGLGAAHRSHMPKYPDHLF